MDEVMVFFVIGLVVGCFVGALLIALFAPEKDDEIPDDTDRER